jgi:RimJ/RimL family protein N-acetyltransferase
VTPDRVFPRVTLPTERLILRPFVPGDAADVHAVWTDEVYLRFAPAQFAHAGASLDRAVEWCARTADQQRQAGKGIALAGAERDTGRLACHVALFGTDWAAMITEIHYWTAAWARGRGYAAEAARAVARWALTEHGFARITLRTVTANTASQKVAGAAGFRFEGVMRNAAWSRAGRGDMAVYSLIPNDLGDAGEPSG